MEDEMKKKKWTEKINMDENNWEKNIGKSTFGSNVSHLENRILKSMIFSVLLLLTVMVMLHVHIRHSWLAENNMFIVRNEQIYKKKWNISNGYLNFFVRCLRCVCVTEYICKADDVVFEKYSIHQNKHTFDKKHRACKKI